MAGFGFPPWLKKYSSPNNLKKKAEGGDSVDIQLELSILLFLLDGVDDVWD